MRHITLEHPLRTVDLGQQPDAGEILVTAAPRTWEKLPPVSSVIWFPQGSTTAVVDPAPGTEISPTTKVSVTFSKPLDALGSPRLAFDHDVAGSWRRRDSHTLVFSPSGTGFGLGAHVALNLPDGVRVAGAADGASVNASGGDASDAGDATASWTVPPGSTLRLHELLAQLHYLPLDFHADAAPVAAGDAAQLQAAIDPPRGDFGWRWDGLPRQLTSQWDPDTTTAITRGALMAFQSDAGLTVDGLAGPDVWGSLIAAAREHKDNRNGYSYVLVHRDAAQQTATLIHDGKTIITTPANTGVPDAPTELGTFPVFLRFQETEMRGTNPDGTRYDDPGIKWVSYFNGGDALHAFNRASFGTPQSVGCVELPASAAQRIYPYTPIGTLVQVAT
jgi:peptidoglycan hydrolase-like protein with peptidoglycan-binding domain